MAAVPTEYNPEGSYYVATPGTGGVERLAQVETDTLEEYFEWVSLMDSRWGVGNWSHRRGPLPGVPPVVTPTPELPEELETPIFGVPATREELERLDREFRARIPVVRAEAVARADAVLSALPDFIEGPIRRVVEAFAAAFEALAAAISARLSAVTVQIADFVGQSVEGLASGMVTVVAGLIDSLSSLVTALSSAVSSLGEDIREAVQSALWGTAVPEEIIAEALRRMLRVTAMVAAESAENTI